MRHAKQTQLSEIEENRRSTKRWRIVFVIALVVFLSSLLVLGLILFSYFQGRDKYSKLTNYTHIDASDFASMTVDWDALRAINPDIVAWIYIPGTVINYPVVKGEDNDYYLSHDFNKDAAWLASYGAIFMDYRNNPDFSDMSYFLYGHHMNDGSMFADIVSMSDQARFDSTRIIYLLSPERNYRLKSYSLVHCEATDPIVELNFPSTMDMSKYVQDKIDRSMVVANEIPPASDIKKSFAFATCDNVYDARYVLFAYILDDYVMAKNAEAQPIVEESGRVISE